MPLPLYQKKLIETPLRDHNQSIPMKTHKPALMLLWLIITTALSTVLSADVPGYGHSRVMAAGYEIQVYTYRPSSCEDPGILLVFHGKNRKAEGVRDKAVRIAEESCLMIFSPLLDEDRFPSWLYQRAGVIKGGKVQPVQRWTYPIVQDLVSFARAEASEQNVPLYLFGHSAGGQFLSRITAYSPSLNADRIVVANPSVHVLPFTDESVPYGYKNLYSEKMAQQKIASYLASPVTIYLGQNDTGEKNLVKSKAAMRQGLNRLERGRNVFARARDFALRNGLVFNWELVEVSDVGHSSRGMLEASELVDILNPSLIPTLLRETGTH